MSPAADPGLARAPRAMFRRTFGANGSPPLRPPAQAAHGRWLPACGQSQREPRNVPAPLARLHSGAGSLQVPCANLQREASNLQVRASISRNGAPNLSNGAGNLQVRASNLSMELPTCKMELPFRQMEARTCQMEAPFCKFKDSSGSISAPDAHRAILAIHPADRRFKAAIARFAPTGARL